MRSKWLRGFLMAGIAACMLLTVALAGTFSVTLPTALPVSVDAEGNVTTAEPIIKNTGSMTVTVAAATVEPLDGWTIVPWGTDFGKLPVSSKKFAMQFYGSEVPADGVIKLPSQSTIPVGGSAAVVYDARIAVQSSAAEDLTIANCCIVVDSDEPEVPTGAVMAANSSWYKSSTPKASITEIELVDRYTPTGAETESWDASAAGDGSVMAYLNGTKLTLAGNGTGKIYANPDASWAFSDAAAMEADEPDLYSAVASITGLELLDTSAVTSMMGMFGGCASLQELDLSGFDTSGVENMQLAFGFCQSLNTLNLGSWDTNAVSNSENMIGMFYQSTIKSITLGEKFVFQAGGYEFFGCSEDIMWQEVGTEKNYTLAEFCALSREGEVTYSLWIFDGLAARDSWYKGSTSKSVITEIELVDRYTPTGAETESWDASAAGDGSVMAYISGTKLILAGNGRGKINANPNSSRLFSDAYDESIDGYDYFGSVSAITGLGLLDISQVKDMSNMFSGCSSLTGLDLSNFDTTSVTDMSHIFSGTNLKKIVLGTKFSFTEGASNFDLGGENTRWTDTTAGKIYSPKQLYCLARTKAVTYIANQLPMMAESSTWYKGNTAKSVITEIELADSYTPTGEETESWDASAAGDRSVMAYITGTKLTLAGNGSGGICANTLAFSAFSNFNCTAAIAGLELLDTASTTTMSGIFSGCSSLTSLDLSGFDTSSVTNMGGAFSGCSSLTSLDLSSFDTSAVTSMSTMFYSCSSLTSLDLSSFDTSSVTDMSFMFAGCRFSQVTLGKAFSFVGENCAINSKGDLWTVADTNEIYTPEELCTLQRKVATTYIAEYSNRLAAGNTWYKGNTAKSKITEINLLTSYTPTGKETESWDASAFSMGGVNAYITGTKLILAGKGVIHANQNSKDAFAEFLAVKSIAGLDKLDTTRTNNMSGMFRGCAALAELDVSNFTTDIVTDMSHMYDGCSKITSIAGLSSFDTSSVTDMSGMFAKSAITSLDGLSNWDTSSVINMSYMFAGISHPFETVNDISGWDTSKVTDMSGMFAKSAIKSLDGLSNWDTSSVINMSYMFADIGYPFETVNDISGWDTSKVTDMSGMFSGCSNLRTASNLSAWDTHSVVNMSNMFDGCASLKNGDFLSNWNTSSVTSMARVFDDCSSLTALNLSGWDTRSVTSMGGMFYNCSSLTSLDLSSFDTSAVTNMSSMFNACYKLAAIAGLSDFDTSSVTTMGGMFNNCQSLDSLDLSAFDTSSVSNMSGMFYRCQSLGSLDLSNFDTSSVTDMSHVFNSCSELTTLNLSGWDTKAAMDMTGLFADCAKLKTIEGLSLWNTSAVTSMGRVFDGCSSLTSLDLKNWKTDTVTEMDGMFRHCYKLEIVEGLPLWNTSAVTDMTALFQGCSSLTSLDLSNWDTSSVTCMFALFDCCDALAALNLNGWDTSSVTDMGVMFESCSSLTGLDLSAFDTSSVSNMSGMFYYCSSLTSLDLSNFDTSSVTNMKAMFALCSSLTVLDLSSWDTKNVTTFSGYGVGTTGMFVGCSNLETIYVSERWSTASATGSTSEIFNGCHNLVGAVAYEDGNNSIDYANYETGYLTYKAAPEGAEQVIAPAGEEPGNGSSADAVTEIEPTTEETQEDTASADGKDEQTAEPPDEGGSAAGIILTLALPAAWKGVLYGKTK